MLFCKDGLGDSNIPTQEIGKTSPAAILKILLWVVWVRAIDLWVGGEGKKGKPGKGEWVTLDFTNYDLAETITWNMAFMYSVP